MINTMKKRIIIVSLIFIIWGLILFSKLVYLTIGTALSGTNLNLKKRILPRGEIYDCNKIPLAVSLPVYSIYCDPMELKRLSSTEIKKIEELFGKVKVNKILKSKRRFYWLKRKVSKSFLKKIKKKKIKGIRFKKEFKRFYPSGSLASSVLGIVNIDEKGLEGVELYYDKFLFPKEEKSFDIVLTIDRNIQFILEQELYSAYKETKADAAVGIIVEPSTGYILGMASFPDFDPNHYQNYPVSARRNRCITDIFEPGSVMKIISTAVLFSEDVINEKDKFYCRGFTLIGGQKLSCWKKHGEITFKEVIKYSCNVGMARSILKLDKRIFFDYLRNFGFGNYTGIDLPGEVKGILRNPYKIGAYSVASIAIGQEIGVTPIQIIMATSAVFNGGKLMQPRIVKSILYPDGRIYKNFSPVVIREVIDSRLSKRIAKLFQGVLEEGGTGELAEVKGYPVAGKTGTAQVYDLKLKQYSPEKVTASFVGFIPAYNPVYGILVLIHKPKVKRKTGGEIAAPVFKRIVQRLLAYKLLPPPPSKKRRVILQPGKYIIKVSSSQILPDFKGLSMRESVKLCKKLKLKPEIYGSGFCIKQTPPPGTKIKENMIVHLFFMP